ncbi:unnamed protein product [Dovyalis caffra]|uniref:Uncharacterized protein n=1 Tax=Dovyalis caffra TaxID=77055 RepID=A0AAV1SX13_9ROSI|nr:unnamed protein product [Dovyalis caffra]
MPENVSEPLEAAFHLQKAKLPAVQLLFSLRFSKSRLDLVDYTPIVGECLLLRCTKSPPPPPPPAVRTVHHMYLVLTWPFGYCSGTQRGLCKMNPLPQDMTIHGIWPVDSAGNFILSCQKAQDLTPVFNDKTL